MSTDVRLDPATLRWCGRWHEAERRASAEHAQIAMEPLLSRVAAAVHERSRAAFAKVAAEAESRPPLLSDWIRACEGTALGKPSADRLVLGYDDGPVHALVRLDDTPTRAYVDARSSAGIVCTTPAELRAALERLAAEAPR